MTKEEEQMLSIIKNTYDFNKERDLFKLRWIFSELWNMPMVQKMLSKFLVIFWCCKTFNFLTSLCM